MAVTGKLNMTDGVRGGLPPAESVEVARILEAERALDALELTGGGSQLNQMYMFRGDPPRKEFAAALHGAQRLGFRVAAPLLFRRYPFGGLLPADGAAVPRRALVAADPAGRDQHAGIYPAGDGRGFDFVAMGRALLREPDLVARMQKGSATAGTCVHCNKCVPSIYTGTRCVLDHPDPGKLLV